MGSILAWTTSPPVGKQGVSVNIFFFVVFNGLSLVCVYELCCSGMVVVVVVVVMVVVVCVCVCVCVVW